MGAGLVCLAVILVYSQALGGGFVYDDKLLVLKNLRLESLGAAMGAFFEPFWSFVPTATFSNSYWRPLTTLSLAIGKSVAGDNPLGFHILSVGLHILASLAAWRLASRLLRSPSLGLAAALLFALHPTHVESVAWISAINDPLHGLFALLALDAFFAWRERGSHGAPMGAGVWLALALLTKEQALTVIPIALAFDLARANLLGVEKTPQAPDDDPLMDWVRAYGPFLAALVLYYIGRVVTFGSILGGFDIVSAGFGLTPGRASQFRIEIMGGFLGHLFWPLNQEVFRQVRPQLPSGHLPWFQALGFTGLWLGATSWAVLSRKKLALGLLLSFPAAFLLVLVRYESAGAFPISDRYLYVPALFAAILVTWALTQRLSRPLALLALSLVTCGLGLRSHAYSSGFQDDESFFRAAIATSPDNTYVRWGMGNVLLERYHRLENKEDLDEAAFHYLMSLKLGTDYGEREPTFTADQSPAKKADALSLLINGTLPEDRRPDNTVMWSLDDRLQANIGQGWCHMFRAMDSKERDLSVAELIFQQTLLRWPDSLQAKLGLGTVLLEMGRAAKAEALLREVVAQSPAYAEAWHNLGLALMDQAQRDRSKLDEGRKCFEQALRFRPHHLSDQINAAKAAIDAQRFDIGKRHLEAAQADHPESTEPLRYLGMHSAARGDLSTALTYFDAVLDRQPNHAEVLLTRGKVLAGLNQPAKAAASLGRACELLPTSFEAYSSMAALMLATEGATEAAMPYLRRAYALGPPDAMRQALHETLKQVTGPQRQELYEYSQLDAARRDYVHALDWLDSALPLYESDASTPPRGLGIMYYERGTFLWALEREPEALEAYRTSLAHDPKPFPPYHDLAVIMSQQPGMGAEAARLAAMALERLESAAGMDQPGYRDAVRKVLEAIVGKN